MIFLDKDTRDSFSKTPPVLQIICSEIEFELAKQRLQVEVIDTSEDSAILAIEHSSDVILQQVCSDVNRRYKRHDKGYTVTMPEEQILCVICADVSELCHVN